MKDTNYLLMELEREKNEFQGSLMKIEMSIGRAEKRLKEENIKEMKEFYEEKQLEMTTLEQEESLIDLKIKKLVER